MMLILFSVIFVFTGIELILTNHELKKYKISCSGSNPYYCEMKDHFKNMFIVFIISLVGTSVSVWNL